jgi:hypothetical protein
VAPEERQGQVTAKGHGTGFDPDKHCGGKTRSRPGGRCTKPKGWGTDHLGIGSCKLHTGSTRNGEKSAAKETALVMGAAMDMEPHEALLWCVRVAAGEVQYASERVAELSEEDAVGPVVTTRPLKYEKGADSLTERVTEEQAPAVHVWIDVRQKALAALAKYSKMAIDAGVAERQVQLAERYGEMIASLIGGILGDLELTKDQQAAAREIVPRRLQALEAG